MSFDLVWLGQGGYLFHLGDKTLCIDPYLSDSVFAAEGLRRMPPVPIEPKDLQTDLIITTHDHMDHLDEDTLREVPPTPIAGPESCLQHLRAIGLAKMQLVALGRGESIQLGQAVLRGVFAEHTDDSIGVVLEYEGISIYLVGDSLFHEKLLEVQKLHPDIMICCINGRWGNMDVMEAAKLADVLKVKAAIPSHYGMFAENTADPEEFHRALRTGINYQALEMGKRYRVEELISGE